MRAPRRSGLAAAVVLAAGGLPACDTSSGGNGRTEPTPVDAGFFTFDFEPADAAPPPPDAAPADPALCEAVCGQLAACAGADDPGHLCDGIDAREVEAFAEMCRSVCMADARFAPSFAGRQACEPLLEQMRAISPDLAYVCVPSPPPETPACAAFAQRTAECVAGECAAVAPVAEGLAYWLRLSCDQSVAAGQLPADRLAGLPGADTPCDDPVAAALVDSLVGSVTDQRTLTTLCFFGPALPEDTCGAACEHLRPCLPARNPLRNEPYCRFLCALDASLKDVLSCAAKAPECGPLSTCFGP